MSEIVKGRNENGLGSFRKKGDKVEYRVSYTDEFGRTRRNSFSADTEEICLDRADRFLEELEQRIAGADLDSTIPDILRKKVQSDYEKNFTGEQGYERNLSVIRIIQRHAIGNIHIVEVNGNHIELFLQSITSYSNNMISKLYAIMRSAYRIAMTEGIVAKNYMELKEFRCPKSDKPDKVIRALTEEEQVLFVKALEEHKVPHGRNSYINQLYIELYAGLRMGEINALRPQDVNLEKGRIHVERTIARGKEYRNFVKPSPKTSAGVRDVPIPKKLRPILKRAMAEMKPNPEGLIFYDHNKGDVVATYQVNSFYQRLCQRAGLPYYGQHALRHTFATRCIEAGVPALVLKNWMGHTDIHITLDTYADVFNRMNLGSVELLDRYMDEMEK